MNSYKLLKKTSEFILVENSVSKNTYYTISLTPSIKKSKDITQYKEFFNSNNITEVKSGTWWFTTRLDAEAAFTWAVIKFSR